MLISEIEPIDRYGQNFLIIDKSINTLIEENIELPLQKACRIFYDKGIETVMSSANKNNLLKPGERPLEKEDVRDQEFFTDRATFEDAGKGYAWIMINFDTLSDENKDMLFRLESKVDKNGEKTGEKLVWFVQPFRVTNIAYMIKTGQFTKKFVASALSEQEMKLYENLEVDERLAEFEKRRIGLMYNGRYPINTVILRMPINEKSTVEEVEEFFVNFTKLFKLQRQLHKPEEKSDEERIN